MNASLAIITPSMLGSKPAEKFWHSLIKLTLPKNLDVSLLITANTTQDKVDSYTAAHAAAIAKLPFPVSFITQGKNTGFAAAVNAGIKASNSDLILTLNDDAYLDLKCLTELVRTQQKTQSDMVAATIYLDRSGTIDSCGFDFAWRGKATALKPGDHGLTSPLSSLSDNWQRHPELLPTSDLFDQPFGPDAAVALYTKKLFTQLGGFTESFFAYLEDVDLALRARLQGMYCVHAPAAIAYHEKHQTSQQMGSFKAKQDVKNWWRIVLGSYPRSVWWEFCCRILLERLKNLRGLC